MTSGIARIVVLAAGMGTRMKSRTPKVLHSVCGLSLVEHVLHAVAAVPCGQTVVVLGHGHEQVRPLLPVGVRVALQKEQKGTGHAVLTAAPEIASRTAAAADGADAAGAADSMLVLPGDTPLVTGEVLRALVEGHRQSCADATVLTMELEDPTGYGRVVRGEDGLVERVVEHRDASPEQRTVREVNSGMYVLPVRRTLEILSTLGTDNAQGELYLTDVIAALRTEGARVGAVRAPDARRLLGVNTRAELAEAAAIMRNDICHKWMIAGVTIDDPSSTFIDVGVTLKPGVRLLPFTLLRGCTAVERDCVIGPSATIVDSIVGAGSRVYNSIVEEMELPSGAEVGPFACLRPEM